MNRRLWKKQLAIALVSGYVTMGASLASAAPMELTLEESIQLALTNNPAVKMAETNKTKASWGVKAARANKAPSVTLTHTSSRVRSDPSKSAGVSQIGERFENVADLTWPIYTSGKVEGTIAQAKLGLKVAELGTAEARQQIKLEATTAYFNLLQAGHLVTLNQESVDRLAAHLKNVQAQYAAGTVAKTDVLRSEVELANAQQDLIQVQNSADLAAAALNNVLGLPLDTQITIKDQLKQEAVEWTMEESIGKAMADRPDAAQAKTNVQIAKYGVTVARSDRYPTIALFASQGYNDDEFPGDDNSNWAVGVSATWNVFDSGLSRSKVRQSQADLEYAKLQQKQALDGVELEVRQAYLNVREAEKRIATNQVAVNKAEEDYKIAQVRYTSGVGTNLDVIDSEVALTRAKTNYIQALYDYNTSRAQLEKAVGARTE
ncbi:TolC family protein [Acetonema longum]|uniref:Outer membrane efflux protein n=1 Tax=Acetonema longum DSM 6540 TaxID=1009370 RepID=F7NM27_9FIRM|nr:TolC family protein [Acetonema longum]EGO62953.1 outer membrane efflux protein [Acetonema longum DSM 6540]